MRRSHRRKRRAGRRLRGRRADAAAAATCRQGERMLKAIFGIRFKSDGSAKPAVSFRLLGCFHRG
jgi:hypothetical protein